MMLNYYLKLTNINRYFFVRGLLIGCFLLGLSNSAHVSAAAGDSLSEVLEDYESKIIVRKSVYEALEEEGDLDEDTISTLSIEEDLSRRLEGLSLDDKSSGKKYILKYNQSALNDITFSELTEGVVKLLPTSGIKFVLDISYNDLTEDSALALQRWIENPAILYVFLDGNLSIAKRNVKKLCEAFIAKLGEEPLVAKKEKIRDSYMRKIIFLPKYYVSTAKRKVRVYRELQERGYLPEDWADIHKEFYRVIEKLPLLELPEGDYSDPDEEAASIEDLE